MGLLSWIVVGGLAGILAKWIMGGNMGCLMTIILGVVGAIIGGFLMNLFGDYGGVNGINIWSILVATLGAVVLLGIARLVRR